MCRSLLPPANVVCEGYVFTGVCLSTGGCIQACLTCHMTSQGDVQAQSWGSVQAQARVCVCVCGPGPGLGGSRPRPGGGVSQHALRQTPLPSRWLLLRAVRIYWNAFLFGDAFQKCESQAVRRTAKTRTICDAKH